MRLPLPLIDAATAGARIGERALVLDYESRYFAAGMAEWPLLLRIVAVCFLLTFLTELTSNMVVLAALLPILAAVSVSLEMDPRLMMIPATIAASCAFMLPIATPPNAIAFGTGMIRMGQMARYGFVLNVLNIALITGAMYALVIPQFGISLEEFPRWAEHSPR